MKFVHSIVWPTSLCLESVSLQKMYVECCVLEKTIHSYRWDSNTSSTIKFEFLSISPLTQSFEFSIETLHSNKCYSIPLFQNICLFSSKNQPYSHEVTTLHSTVAESGHSCLCSCSRSCLRTCSHNRSNMVLRDWKVTFTGLGIHIHSKDMRAGHIALLIHTYI